MLRNDGKVRFPRDWSILDPMVRNQVFEYCCDISLYHTRETRPDSYADVYTLVQACKELYRWKHHQELNKQMLILEMKVNGLEGCTLAEYEANFYPPFVIQQLILSEYKRLVTGKEFKYRYGSKKFREYEKNYFFFVKRIMESMGYSLPLTWLECLSRNILILDYTLKKTGLASRKENPQPEDSFVDSRELEAKANEQKLTIHRETLNGDNLSGVDLLDLFSENGIG